VRAVPRLCEFYPGICLTTEEKARKNLSLLVGDDKRLFSKDMLVYKKRKKGISLQYENLKLQLPRQNV